MEKKESNFRTLKKWIVQTKERDELFDLEIQYSLSKSEKISMFEKTLSYSIVGMIFLFVIILIFNN